MPDKFAAAPMKPIIITLLLCLPGATGFGQMISPVEAPQDDLNVLGGWNCLSNHPELQSLADDYNQLLRVRFWPLKMNDIDAVFGARLDQKPADRVKPLFVPMIVCEPGLMPANNNKRHIDFHAIGNIGYLEARYNAWDGTNMTTAVIYLRADASFIPLKSTNDIPRREAWDKARYDTLKKWLDAHLPGLTDLGVVKVSPAYPAHVDLGGGVTCVLTTRDIHNANVPFWLTIDIAKETRDPKEKSFQSKSVDRPNEPFGFAMDGRFYKLTPELAGSLPDSK